MSPQPQFVRQRAWTAAEEAARAAPGRTVLVGSGSSMMPLYPSGTVLVVQRVGWAQLRAGMTVIYVRQTGVRGEVVGHVLTINEARGWVAQGLNNREPDAGLVTPDNYIGAVVAAYLEQREPRALAAEEKDTPAVAAADAGSFARPREGALGVWLAAVE